MNKKYTEIETHILNSLYKKYKVVVDSRSRDDSRVGWEKLTAEYNRSSGIINERNVRQIKSKIQNMKNTQQIPAPSRRHSTRSRANSTASRISENGSEQSRNSVNSRRSRKTPDRRAQRSNSQSSMLENDEQSKRLELLDLQIKNEQWKMQVLQHKSAVQQKKIEKLVRELSA